MIRANSKITCLADQGARIAITSALPIASVALLMLGACLLAGSANAGILVSNNNTGLIQGTTTVNDTNIAFLGNIEADIDWSVFAPGADFQTFLSDNGLVDPEVLSQTNYIYAYQLFNTASAEPTGAPLDLTVITVGLDMGDPVAGAAPSSLSTAVGDVIPVATSFAGTVPTGVTSAVWNFFDGGNQDLVPQGEQSGLLYFASPNPPEFDNVVVTSGAVIGQSIADQTSGEPSGPGVPSPDIPEPASLLVFALGGIGLMMRRN